MLTFHCFPLLPVELRQRIWMLSMEPRQIVYGKEPPSYYQCPWPASAPPPPLLHTCDESRAQLKRHYVKAFVTEKAPEKYTWVNFDIDTVYLAQHNLKNLHAECPMVRKIILLGIDSEMFFHFYHGLLWGMKHLETVDILHMESPGKVDDEWWTGWDSMMEAYYFRDDPVPFYTRILYPQYPPYEINADNYLKVERDKRRKLLAEHPDWYEPGYEISDDDDDDVCGPNRFRTGYRRRVEG
ncbi:hypothetical protein CH63R_13191 [Colletotrichum higginsianum IMI 349063]|uniref:2EXR domain-containing protein n=2 Tax=Colletotrichum higginsianum TaxID=80884 RepID=A0A1B7XWD1_COLHI|nr:hypothetical protein CH63R_13191 [Colletotrichum higginsianum IMI 349063]OBR04064.1 hypothetical protein CH63R_13191 [Colletotrichum higginsianum IMI 349063]TIC90122.1 hypothetical protein CH35J_012054 [Colletotrichum higginsianum]